MSKANNDGYRPTLFNDDCSIEIGTNVVNFLNKYLFEEIKLFYFLKSQANKATNNVRFINNE